MSDAKSRVRRVIQHKRTHLYLTVSGGWTSDLETAHQMPDVLCALRMSRSLALTEVELVLKFEEGRYDVRLDL